MYMVGMVPCNILIAISTKNMAGKNVHRGIHTHGFRAQLWVLMVCVTMPPPLATESTQKYDHQYSVV